jgi:hypothetical protein
MAPPPTYRQQLIDQVGGCPEQLLKEQERAEVMAKLYTPNSLRLRLCYHCFFLLFLYARQRDSSQSSYTTQLLPPVV